MRQGKHPKQAHDGRVGVARLQVNLQEFSGYSNAPHNTEHVRDGPGDSEDGHGEDIAVSDCGSLDMDDQVNKVQDIPAVEVCQILMSLPGDKKVVGGVLRREERKSNLQSMILWPSLTPLAKGEYSKDRNN
jgi:hypothetical protein